MRRIETLDDLVECFQRFGWTPGRDEVGDRNAEMRVGDKILHPLLSRRDTRYSGNPNGFLLFEMGGWVKCEAVSIAYTLMTNPKKRLSYSCPVANSPNYKIQQPLVYEDDVKAISDAYIDWGRNYDMDAGLKALRELPTDSIGAMPARHLAALAAHGDVERLTYYRDCFAKGDRAGFVCDYITDHYVNTALDFAQLRRADPNWLPKTPRMRV
jgi:hypothetical protein